MKAFYLKKKGRFSKISSLKNEERTLIFYESPHRILKTLMQFETAYGKDRQVSVSRELSKKFEQTVNGSLSTVRAHFEKNKPKGEFVIVLSGKPI